jgi:hypothetical protein
VVRCSHGDTRPQNTIVSQPTTSQPHRPKPCSTQQLLATQLSRNASRFLHAPCSLQQLSRTCSRLRLRSLNLSHVLSRRLHFAPPLPQCIQNRRPVGINLRPLHECHCRKRSCLHCCLCLPSRSLRLVCRRALNVHDECKPPALADLWAGTRFNFHYSQRFAVLRSPHCSLPDAHHSHCSPAFDGRAAASSPPPPGH